MQIYNPPVHAKSKSRLRVLCSDIRQAGLDRFEKTINDMIDFRLKHIDRRYADSRIPMALLFAEDAISRKYAQGLTHNIVFDRAESIHANWSGIFYEQWLCIFFSAPVLYEGYPANMGYLISPAGVQSQPKRYYITEYDSFHLSDYDKTRINDFETAWIIRKHKLNKSHTPYLNTKTPDGVRIEARICADVQSPPLLEDSEITLVSAANINNKQFETIKRARSAIVVNDPYAHPLSPSVYYPENGKIVQEFKPYSLQFRIAGKAQYFYSDILI